MKTKIVEKMTKAEAGRAGGMATLKRCGRKGMSGRGQGRHQLPTYEEIRQQQLLEQNNNDKEVITDPPGNLTQLRKLCKLRYGSNSNTETAQAGIAQNTPTGQSLPERNAVSR